MQHIFDADRLNGGLMMYEKSADGKEAFFKIKVSAD